MGAHTTQVITEAIVVDDDPSVRITQAILEVVAVRVTPSPTTPTGVGVTQVVAEAVTLPGSPDALVSQVILECIIRQTDVSVPGGGTGEGGHFGYGSIV